MAGGPAFAVASHSYFRPVNQEGEKRRFLQDASYVPRFAYGPLMDEVKVAARLAAVPPDTAAHQSLTLVACGLALRQSPDAARLEAFRTANRALFEEPTPRELRMLFARMRALVTAKTADDWQYIVEHIPSTITAAIADDMSPSPACFARYRRYFQTYARPEAWESGRPLPELLGQALQSTRLASLGWSVRVRGDASPAKVSHRTKRVFVGKQYVPRTRPAGFRIVAHELYGHALRGRRGSIAESEGFAILLEQLLDERFVFRRTYRYLAVALGWGAAGRPMTFREVYEIVWRAMVVARSYSPEKARSYAFDECARAFRGGRPDTAGAVYLKDSVYFAANIAIWQQLAAHPLEYNEFVDVIEGRRNILP